MTQYNTLNLNLFESQLNKEKLGIENGVKVPLNISLYLIIYSNDEINFLHILLLI